MSPYASTGVVASCQATDGGGNGDGDSVGDGDNGPDFEVVAKSASYWPPLMARC